MYIYRSGPPLLRRFTREQIAGCTMVMLGVAVAAVPPRLLPWAGAGGILALGSPLPGSAAAAAALVLDPAMVACGIVCFAFPALASTIKVRICFLISRSSSAVDESSPEPHSADLSGGLMAPLLPAYVFSPPALASTAAKEGISPHVTALPQICC